MLYFFLFHFFYFFLFFFFLFFVFQLFLSLALYNHYFHYSLDHNFHVKVLHQYHHSFYFLALFGYEIECLSNHVISFSAFERLHNSKKSAPFGGNISAKLPSKVRSEERRVGKEEKYR